MIFPNTPFAVERLIPDSHFLVTEAGETLGFTAGFDATLGGVRDGILGASDEAWIPESGLYTRVPGSLRVTAYLVDRDRPKRDSDKLVRLLGNVRELWLPDGQVIPLHYAALVARPRDDKLELLLMPTGANDLHPLLDVGELNLAFPTESSTPEVPIYGFDSAGSIRSPLSMTRVQQGSLHVGAYITEAGVWGLASVGTPIGADGVSPSDAATLSFQTDKLVAQVGAARAEVPISAMVGEFSADSFLLFGWPVYGPPKFSALLKWTQYTARLFVMSEAGLQQYELGAPGILPNLSERVLTAGTRADGIGMGGYATIPDLFFLPKPLEDIAAMRLVRESYEDLTQPNMTWAVQTPDLSLEISRTDTKALELAPGESLTFDLAVKRIGGYTGTLDVTTTAQEGITASAALLSASGDTDTYRVTISAPVGAVEQAYTFRFSAKATGADNPGSLLVDVRDDFDALVEVAASPAIADNPTVFLQANDPVQYRATEFLRDFSAYGNTFSWSSYARPNRAGNGVLVTGYRTSLVYSGALTNTAAPQRLNGQQSYCAIFAEVAKTPVGGVMMQIAADNSDDHILLRRVQGGFSLRHTIGGVTVTSPDVLLYESGYAELGLRVTLTEIILTDRSTMRSIRVPRPALPDAGVRIAWGGTRSSVGGHSNVTRTHLMAATIHPYALSDIQFRRNMDRLRDYAPAPDGLPEYADSALIIAEFNDNTTEQPEEKLKNRAAPAIGITLVNKGGVAYIPGGVNPDGSVEQLITTEFESLLPTSIALEAVAAIQDISYGTDYDTQFGISDSGKTNGYTTVSRRYDGVARVRTLNDGGTFVSKDLPKTPKTGNTVFCLKVTESGKRVDATELMGGETVTLIRDAGWTGNYAFSFGGVWRADLTNKFPGRTKGMGLMVARGALTAQERSDAKTLLTR